MKTFKFILKSVVFCSIIIILLFLTKKYTLDSIVDLFEGIRGTENYEGETKTNEFFFILTRFIIPIVLLLSFVFVSVYSMLKRKKGNDPN